MFSKKTLMNIGDQRKQYLVVIFRRLWNIQEKLFIQYSVQWGQFFSVQNCQLFLFKNKWQQ